MKSLKQRFESKIVDRAVCWVWGGAKSVVSGYGHIKHEGKVLIASRVSYQLYIGEIPDGLHVLHKCDNPSCVNPDHLFLGTHGDNMRDMFSKGRRKSACGLRNGKGKLTDDDIATILSVKTASETLGPVLGVSGSRVRQIRRAAIVQHVNQ